jgi:hypothetical protein
MTTVRIHTQDFDRKFDREGYQFFTSDWSLPRKHVYTYLTEAEGHGAAEEAFHIFNAPEELLEEWQQYIAKAYSGPSLSVGDIVEVNDEEYLCCSLGWKTRTEEDSVAVA